MTTIADVVVIQRSGLDAGALPVDGTLTLGR
jgi:hypothetical protein